jgi:hypothetical protein
MPLVLPLVDYMDTTEDYANDYAQEWFDPIAAYVSGNDFVGSFTLDSASYVSGSVTGLWTGLVIVDQEPTEADPVPYYTYQGGVDGGAFENIYLEAGSYRIIVGTFSALSPASPFTLNLDAVQAGINEPIDGGNVTLFTDDTTVAITGLSTSGMVSFTDNYAPAEVDLPNVGYAITLSGPGFAGANITINYDWGFIPLQIAYSTDSGAWNFVNQLGSWTANQVDFTLSGKDDPEQLQIVFPQAGDQTLPVVLSGFNAVLTAENYVALSWTTESESGMMGYRLYRSENNDAASAILLNPYMIPATNTSTTQVYTYEDFEVEFSHTYYYWLESLEYHSSNFYGPIIVEVTAPEIPQLPLTSSMKSPYPNPFKPGQSANIEVSVKAEETATISIYNVAGQLVQRYTVNEGNHNLNWSGHDSNGKLCGSGIYFFKFSTPSVNQIKKMTIIK